MQFYSRKKRNVLLNKKLIFVFVFIYDVDHFLYYPQMSVFSFRCFTLILVFKKVSIETFLARLEPKVALYEHKQLWD